MEKAQFDTFARTFSEVRSRRSLGRLIAALSVVGAASALPLGEAMAKKHKKHKKHRKHKRSKVQIDTLALGQVCTSNGQCVGDLVCQIANSQNMTPGRANTPVCCVPTDVHARCNDGTDCCGVSVICNGGYCQSA